LRGHIRKRGTKWAVVVELDKDAEGKRKQRWYSGYNTKKEAEKAVAEIINQLENNGLTTTTKLTTGDYLKQWYQTYCEPNLEKTTLDGYSIILFKHLIPKLGKIQLQKLTALHIREYYTKAQESGRLDGKGGLSGKTLKQHHRVLREALKHAVQMQLIDKNPADAVDSPKVKKYKAEVLKDTQEMSLFLTSLDGQPLELPIHLAIGAGLRRSEVLGLRWKDIDFKEKTLTINQVLVRANKELFFKQPKSETSNREIKIPNTLYELLKKYKVKVAQNKLLLGSSYEDNDLVVCNVDGTPINPGTFSHWFKDFLEKHNLKKIRFHDLRHTFATWLLKAGVPLKVVSDMLGHSTIAISADLYSHVVKDMQEDAANKLDDILYKAEAP
jgi:integrase